MTILILLFQLDLETCRDQTVPHFSTFVLKTFDLINNKKTGITQLFLHRTGLWLLQCCV